MDEQEFMKLAHPLTQETIPDFLERINAWFILHKNDKITLLQKIKNCCSFVNLDINNIVHVQFITTTFQQSFIASGHVKEAFKKAEQQLREAVEDVSVG